MTVYFAYGSNLWLPQMARRCPCSQFLGRAVLTGYRIQINSRGYANIIEDNAEKVEGLCFLLAPEDETALDESEGVAMSCYTKSKLQVRLFVAPPSLCCRRVVEIIQDAPDMATETVTKNEEGAGPSVASLVYISTIHVSEGTAKDLYK
ncbi:hypothetical protein EDC01DRAFT_781981 [Geopyxis carbonaria]|nr:hypothetical protein EDC01DRAFT_781981 [Geopyxis carbonaria]